MRPECEQFPVGSRKRSICDGTADLPQATIDAYRIGWGFDPLFDAHAVGSPIDRPPIRVTAKRATEGSFGSAKRKEVVPGPGTELLAIYSSSGVPPCQACYDLAEKMNQWGVGGCREKLDEIVEDIFPRAKEWVKANMPWTHTLLPGLVEDFGIRRKIRSDVTEAIRRAEVVAAAPKKNEPTPEPRSPNVGVARAANRGCPPLPVPPQIDVTPQDVAERCEVVVKSFRRHAALHKFLSSLWERYPGLPVLIADDSFAAGEQLPPIVQQIRAMPHVRWFQMPFDSGLSAGRNLCVREATRDILILADDDYVVTEETRLERLVAALDARPDVSLVAGCIRSSAGAQATQWMGRIQVHPVRLHIYGLTSPWRTDGGVRNRDTDLCWNFFAARRDSLIAVPWDDRLKIAGEHIDFFAARKQAGQLSAFTDEVVILHEKQQPAGYANFRNRTEQFYALLRRKWGVAKIGSAVPMPVCGGAP